MRLSAERFDNPPLRTAEEGQMELEAIRLGNVCVAFYTFPREPRVYFLPHSAP